MEIPDDDLIRRYPVLYPQPTQYQVAWAEVMQKTLKEGGEEAEMLRQRLRPTRPIALKQTCVDSENCHGWYIRYPDRHVSMFRNEHSDRAVVSQKHSL